MHKKMQNYKVTISDATYSLMTNESEEHVVKAASYVDALLKEVQDRSALDEKKVAILVALRLASKVLSLEETLVQQRCKSEQLIQVVDRELCVNLRT
jgi:cell division protein ZapA (FtsZ GTPase activity inhibitor)